MAEIEINELQEFYTVSIDQTLGTVSICNSSGTEVNNQSIVTPQYGGLYAAFNSSQVVTLDGLQDIILETPNANNEQVFSLPAFSGYLGFTNFTGPTNINVTSAADAERVLTFEQNNQRVRVFAGNFSTTQNRVTTSTTKTITLDNLLASDYRSYVTAREQYEYPTTSTGEGVSTSGGLFGTSISDNFFIDRVINYSTSDVTVIQGRQSLAQGILYALPNGESDFDGFDQNKQYVDGFFIGDFNETTGELILDTPVVDRQLYFLSLGETYNAQSRTRYVVERGGIGSAITVSALVALLEATPFWGTTIYEERANDTAPWVPITAGQFAQGNELMDTQDGFGGSGYVVGLSSTPQPLSNDRFVYTKLLWRDMFAKQGYLCRSKGNGLFDIFTVTSGVPGNGIFRSNTLTQPALLPTPALESYSKLNLLIEDDLTLVLTDTPFWPHAIEGKDTFAVRNWESMQIKKEDSVIYSDVERANRLIQGGITT